MRKQLPRLIVCNILKVIFVCNFVTSNENYNNYSEDLVMGKVVPLIEKWAPKVWLDPQEKFFPSNVDTFLRKITPSKENKQNVYRYDTNIPVGGYSNDFYLVTNQNKDALLKNPESFLYGVNPSKQNVSIYANVKSCDPNYNSFIVTYWFFYPFNEGKEVCTIPGKQLFPIFKVFNKCLGRTRVLGNHIGDWERISLEFKNRTPTSLFLSVHDVGVVYSYDAYANIFVLSEAKAKGLLKQPQDPPKTVRVNPRGHPVLFSARGSHALWAEEGIHKYTKLNLRALSDETGFGTPWETWRSVEVFYSAETTPDWYHYQGRWGNPRSNCLTRDICEFGDGPRGLVSRPQDFSCAP